VCEGIDKFVVVFVQKKKDSGDETNNDLFAILENWLQIIIDLLQARTRSCCSVP
jgi:hypothetical protein